MSAVAPASSAFQPSAALASRARTARVAGPWDTSTPRVRSAGRSTAKAPVSSVVTARRPRVRPVASWTARVKVPGVAAPMRPSVARVTRCTEPETVTGRPAWAGASASKVTASSWRSRVLPGRAAGLTPAPESASAGWPARESRLTARRPVAARAAGRRTRRWGGRGGIEGPWLRERGMFARPTTTQIRRSRPGSRRHMNVTRPPWPQIVPHATSPRRMTRRGLVDAAGASVTDGHSSPLMNASTRRRPSSSGSCTGGDFIR